MLTLTGTSVFKGIAIGPVKFYKRDQKSVEKYKVQDIVRERKRFDDAKEKALLELDVLYNKALKEVGKDSAMIFDVHKMMLEDLDYCDSVYDIIDSKKLNAEFAVSSTAEEFAAMFSSMDDPYMQGRAADVKDVSNRVLNILSGGSGGVSNLSFPVIIASDDLAPSETVQLDKSNVLAIVTSKGSSNSHTAILARTMGIPAIVNIGDKLTEDSDGYTAIIDGYTGTLYINPDKRTEQLFSKKKKEDEEKNKILQELKGLDNITIDGRRIDVYANIGNPKDIELVLKNDAGGIGLFRSEFLYLENSTYPTEEQQFSAYKTVVESMNGKRVIIRTLDIGADKKADYFELDDEENPALGLRAIRICLTRPELFKTQLRAICRASAFGKVAIMFPMITSVSEVKRCKLILSEVQSELKKEKIDFDENVEIGIMIETPAAAIISDLLAKEVDFFSVGTNDLTQYTLSVDRQNQNLESFVDVHHASILRLINLATKNAHKEGKWIGICGELGADLELTTTFLAMGVDELSVSSSMILPLRKQIRETDLRKIKEDFLSLYSFRV